MMTSRIYRYELSTVQSKQIITMPKDAALLSIQVQHNKPQAWVLIPNSDALLTQYTFHCFETGEYIDAELLKTLHYMGTAVLREGNYVVHYFVEM